MKGTNLNCKNAIQDGPFSWSLFLMIRVPLRSQPGIEGHAMTIDYPLAQCDKLREALDGLKHAGIRCQERPFIGLVTTGGGPFGRDTVVQLWIDDADADRARQLLAGLLPS